MSNTNGEKETVEEPVSRRKLLSGVGTATAGLAMASSAEADNSNPTFSQRELINSLGNINVVSNFLDSHEDFLSELADQGILDTSEIDELLSSGLADGSVTTENIRFSESQEEYRLRVVFEHETNSGLVTFNLVPQTGELAVIEGSDPHPDVDVYTNELQETLGPASVTAITCEPGDTLLCKTCECATWIEDGMYMYECYPCCSGTRYCAMWNYFGTCYTEPGPHCACSCWDH